MKKSLISPNERVMTGWRVAEVTQKDFPVADPLFWIDCDDNVVADLFWYDPTDQLIKIIPVSIETNPLEQPTSTGTQTL